MGHVTSIFSSKVLSDCSVAFGRRRKAIRHRAKSLTIKRVVEVDGQERLNIDVATLVDRPTQVRLSLWADGTIWFRAAQPGPRSRGGWDFLLTFDGTLGDVRPEELISTLEASLIQLHGHVRDGAAERVLALWSRIQPKAG